MLIRCTKQLKNKFYMCKDQIFILLLIMKTVFTSVMISLMLFTKGDAPQYKKNIKSVSNKSLNECKYFFLKHTEL